MTACMAAMRRSSRAAASALFTCASVNALDSACSSIQVVRYISAFGIGDCSVSELAMQSELYTVHYGWIA